MNQYILFDLDGTLTDSTPGIVNCFRYTLDAFGITDYDEDKLSLVVGPPLKDSFTKIFGFSEEDADKAIVKYRERYIPIGIFENALFPGIDHMLMNLKKHGATLAVASSKREDMVHTVLKHFNIEKYFEVIVGSNDGDRTTKEHVIEEALHQLFNGGDIEYDNIVMVGDRKYDIIGAKQYNISSVGITYDGVFLEELKAEGADYIVFTAKELEELLLRGRKKSLVKEEKTTLSYRLSSPLIVIYDLIIPIAIYYCGTNILRMVNYSLWGGQLNIIKGLIFLVMAAIMFYLYGYVELRNARFSYKVRNANILRGSEPIYRKNVLGAITILFVMISGALFSIAFNTLFTLTGISSMSANFTEVMEVQQSVSILEGIFIYGICSPIAEELMFRGILYNRLKRHFSMISAGIVSALFFGAYHGNLVQGLYGFVAGILLFAVYEKSGSLLWVIFLHGIINLVGFALSSIVSFAVFCLNPFVCAISFVLMLILLYLAYAIEKKNKGID